MFPASKIQKVGAYPSECLFIGDLSVCCTEENVQELFGQYGQIVTVRIKQGKADAKAVIMGFGFITFASVEDANNAKDNLHGYYFWGRNLRVYWASPETTNIELPVTIELLFSFKSAQVHNLIYEQTVKDLIPEFVNCEVVDVAFKSYIVVEAPTKSFGSGFIHFALNNQGVQAALELCSVLNNVSVDGIHYDVKMAHSFKDILAANPSLYRPVPPGTVQRTRRNNGGLTYVNVPQMRHLISPSRGMFHQRKLLEQQQMQQQGMMTGNQNLYGGQGPAAPYYPPQQQLYGGQLGGYPQQGQSRGSMGSYNQGPYNELHRAPPAIGYGYAGPTRTTPPPAPAPQQPFRNPGYGVYDPRNSSASNTISAGVPRVTPSYQPRPAPAAAPVARGYLGAGPAEVLRAPAERPPVEITHRQQQSWPPPSHQQYQEAEHYSRTPQSAYQQGGFPNQLLDEDTDNSKDTLHMPPQSNRFAPQSAYRAMAQPSQPLQQSIRANSMPAERSTQPTTSSTRYRIPEPDYDDEEALAAYQYALDQQEEDERESQQQQQQQNQQHQEKFVAQSQKQNNADSFFSVSTMSSTESNSNTDHFLSSPGLAGLTGNFAGLGLSQPGGSSAAKGAMEAESHEEPEYYDDVQYFRKSSPAAGLMQPASIQYQQQAPQQQLQQQSSFRSSHSLSPLSAGGSGSGKLTRGGQNSTSAAHDELMQQLNGDF